MEIKSKNIMGNEIVPKVALIILLYNGRKYIDDLFFSLSQVDYPPERWEIIVVDNASSDESLEHLEHWLQTNALRPRIHIIKNTENLGFAEGNNIGIKYAFEHYFNDEDDFVYLLNQDTTVEPDFLRQAVEAAKKESAVGSVQSRLMLWPDKNLINSVGNAIHFLGFGYALGYKSQFPIFPDRSRDPYYGRDNFSAKGGSASGGQFPIDELAYASGAGVLYSAAALKQVGLFDGALFAYHEDLDLGWRLRLFGFRNILASNSVVCHKYEFSRSIKKYYFMERNRFIVMLKNYKWQTLFLIFLPWLLMELGVLFFSLFSGWFWEKLRAYKYFLSLENWRRILAKRREIQKNRRVGDREIVRLFVGKIEFQDIQNPLLKYIVNPVFDAWWRIIKWFI